MLFIVFSAAVLLFGFVLLYGAPYLPTQRRQVQVALELLDLKKGQTLYELGCGDGRVLLFAAKQGLDGVGYELNPLLVLTAKIVTWRYRKQIKIVWGNFWQADLSNADGVFVFLLDKFMLKLDKKVKRTNKRIRVASFTFKIPGKKILTSKEGIFLYQY